MIAYDYGGAHLLVVFFAFIPHHNLQIKIFFLLEQASSALDIDPHIFWQMTLNK